MKLRLSFYYVGDINAATELYSRLLEASPIYADDEWVRFHLEGGDLALHLDKSLSRTAAVEPVRFGAIVSLSVDDIHAFLSYARDCDFRPVGPVQELLYGFQVELRDPWGNRLSVLQPKEA